MAIIQGYCSSRLWSYIKDIKILLIQRDCKRSNWLIEGIDMFYLLEKSSNNMGCYNELKIVELAFFFVNFSALT